MEKKISVLSGGERARLALCKIILSKVNLLILDEPTNHLDIGSREVLEEAISEFNGTVIAVSHDRYFIKKLATRIFDMSNGFYDWHGGYDDYLAYKERKNTFSDSTSAESTASKETQSKTKYLENKKLLSDIRKNEKIIEKSEEKINKLDEEKEMLSKEAAGSAATDYVRLSEISERIAEIEKETDGLFTAIEEAENFLSSAKQEG